MRRPRLTLTPWSRALVLTTALFTTSCGLDAQRQAQEAKAALAQSEAERAMLRTENLRLQLELKEQKLKVDRLLTDLTAAKDELERVRLQKELEEARRAASKRR